MKRTDVVAVVIQALTEMLEATKSTVPAFTEDLVPIGDLPMFDSIVSEDVTATILARLGAPSDTKNPFTQAGARGAPTLGQVVDRICRALGVVGS